MASANEQLGDAAGRGDVPEIERQIAAGADPNAFEGTAGARPGPKTPLQMAAARGHVAAIAVLLKAGARVDGVDCNGWTPLMYAANGGHTAAIDALVAAGADVHRTNNGGNTALHCASAKGQKDAARVLLEAGAKTDVRNKDGLLFGKRPIDLVSAPLARSLLLRDRVTPLCRRVTMRRFASTPLTNPPRPLCARCWRHRPP
jgi:uncharacterized protein